MADILLPSWIPFWCPCCRQFPDFFVLNLRRFGFHFSPQKDSLCLEFSARLPDDILPIWSLGTSPLPWIIPAGNNSKLCTFSLCPPILSGDWLFPQDPWSSILCFLSVGQSFDAPWRSHSFFQPTCFFAGSERLSLHRRKRFSCQFCFGSDYGSFRSKGFHGSSFLQSMWLRDRHFSPLDLVQSILKAFGRRLSALGLLIPRKRMFVLELITNSSITT